MFDTLSKDYSNGDFENKKVMIEDNKIRDAILTVLVYIMIILIIAVIGSFMYYAFIDNPVLNKTLSLNHLNYVLENNIGNI